MKEFIGSCVENPFEDVNKLSEVIDGGIEITEEEFLRVCDVGDMDLFKEPIKISFKNYPQSFSFYKNGEIYFFENSAIEYFFK